MMLRLIPKYRVALDRHLEALVEDIPYRQDITDEELTHLITSYINPKQLSNIFDAYSSRSNLAHILHIAKLYARFPYLLAKYEHDPQFLLSFKNLIFAINLRIDDMNELDHVETYFLAKRIKHPAFRYILSQHLALGKLVSNINRTICDQNLRNLFSLYSANHFVRRKDLQINKAIRQRIELELHELAAPQIMNFFFTMKNNYFFHGEFDKEIIRKCMAQLPSMLKEFEVDNRAYLFRIMCLMQLNKKIGPHFRWPPLYHILTRDLEDNLNKLSDNGIMHLVKSAQFPDSKHFIPKILQRFRWVMQNKPAQITNDFLLDFLNNTIGHFTDQDRALILAEMESREFKPTELDKCCLVCLKMKLKVKNLERISLNTLQQDVEKIRLLQYLSMLRNEKVEELITQTMEKPMDLKIYIKLLDLTSSPNLKKAIMQKLENIQPDQAYVVLNEIQYLYLEQLSPELIEVVLKVNKNASEKYQRLNRKLNWRIVFSVIKSEEILETWLKFLESWRRQSDQILSRILCSDQNERFGRHQVIFLWELLMRSRVQGERLVDLLLFNEGLLEQLVEHDARVVGVLLSRLREDGEQVAVLLYGLQEKGLHRRRAVAEEVARALEGTRVDDRVALFMMQYCCFPLERTAEVYNRLRDVEVRLLVLLVAMYQKHAGARPLLEEQMRRARECFGVEIE